MIDSRIWVLGHQFHGGHPVWVTSTSIRGSLCARGGDSNRAHLIWPLTPRTCALAHVRLRGFKPVTTHKSDPVKPSPTRLRPTNLHRNSNPDRWMTSWWHENDYLRPWPQRLSPIKRSKFTLGNSNTIKQNVINTTIEIQPQLKIHATRRGNKSVIRSDSNPDNKPVVPKES